MDVNKISMGAIIGVIIGICVLVFVQVASGFHSEEEVNIYGFEVFGLNSEGELDVIVGGDYGTIGFYLDGYNETIGLRVLKTTSNNNDTRGNDGYSWNVDSVRLLNAEGQYGNEYEFGVNDTETRVLRVDAVVPDSKVILIFEFDPVISGNVFGVVVNTEEMVKPIVRTPVVVRPPVDTPVDEEVVKENVTKVNMTKVNMTDIKVNMTDVNMTKVNMTEVVTNNTKVVVGNNTDVVGNDTSVSNGTKVKMNMTDVKVNMTDVKVNMTDVNMTDVKVNMTDVVTNNTKVDIVNGTDVVENKTKVDRGGIDDNEDEYVKVVCR